MTLSTKEKQKRLNQKKIDKILSKRLDKDTLSIVKKFNPTKKNLQSAINRVNKKIIKYLGKKDITKFAMEGQALQEQLDKLN